MTDNEEALNRKLYEKVSAEGPADIILDREKGMDYVHKGTKGKGTYNV